VCTLSTPSVAVTNLEVRVSVNCELTLICDSDDEEVEAAGSTEDDVRV